MSIKSDVINGSDSPNPVASNVANLPSSPNNIPADAVNNPDSPNDIPSVPAVTGGPATGYTGYLNLLDTSLVSRALPMITPEDDGRFTSLATYESLRFRFDQLTTIDFVALDEHNAGIHDGGSTIRFEYTLGFQSGGTLIQEVTFTDNEPVILTFPAVECWGVIISFVTATVGLEMGVLYAGSQSIPSGVTSNPYSVNSIPSVPPVTSSPSFAKIGYKNDLKTSVVASALPMLTANTYERFVSAATTESLRFRFDQLTTVDFVGLAAHNAGTHDGGCTIRFEYFTTFSGGGTLIEEVTFTEDEPIMLSFTPVACWGVIISFTTTTVGLEMGVLYSGSQLEMRQPIYGGHSPIGLSGRTKYESVMSVSGNFLGRTVQRQGTQSTFAWQHLPPDWYRTYFQPFVKSAVTTPFFIQWRPDLYPNEVAYGFTTQDIQPVNMGGGSGLISVEVNMKGHSD